MSVNCKTCVVEGDLKQCLSTPCTYHDVWYLKSIKAENKALKKQVKSLTAQVDRSAAMQATVLDLIPVSKT